MKLVSGIRAVCAKLVVVVLVELSPTLQGEECFFFNILLLHLKKNSAFLKDNPRAVILQFMYL